MRMLEENYIQIRGFHNIVKDGKTVGFQFRLRSNYYRGMFLSQLRFGKVIVDGKSYEGDDVIWCINGVDYYPSDMEKLGNVMWHNQDCAVIKILNGGLEQGYHDLEVRYTHICSYMPPQFDNNHNFEADRPERGEWPHARLILV